MKPHRQIRTSKRVGSDSGVAFADMIGDPAPSKLQIALQEVEQILSRLPHSERISLIAELAKNVRR